MEAETAGESIAASHIVAHVNESRSEPQARSLMERAQGQLLQGISFEEVAETFSDCKGNGGFDSLLYRRLDATWDEYLSALEETRD